MTRCGPCTARAGAPWPSPRRWAAAGAPCERYLQMPTWPVRQHRRHYGRSILNPYKAYLLERWNAGLPYRHPAVSGAPSARVHGQLSPRHGLCQPHPPSPGHPTPPPGPAPAAPRGGGARLPALDAPPGDLAGAAARQRSAQRPRPSSSPSSTRNRPRWPRRSTSRRTLPRSCASASPTHLDPWLARATTSALEAMQRFASGLREDYAAVKAGRDLALESAAPSRATSIA